MKVTGELLVAYVPLLNTRSKDGQGQAGDLYSCHFLDTQSFFE